MLFAPEISPLPPELDVNIPFAVIVTIVLPATLARIFPLAPEKYTLLVPFTIYEPDPPPLTVALLIAVIRPLAAIVITGIVVVLPYCPAVTLTFVTSVFACVKAPLAYVAAELAVPKELCK